MSCNSCNSCKSKQQEKEIKVAYLCDKRACSNCSESTCRHTFDIRHAKNFKKICENEKCVIFEEHENNENVYKYLLSFFEHYLLDQLLNKNYKWIARDDNNSLFVYKNKPTHDDGIWNDFDRPDDYGSLGAFDDLFKFVKRENEQPTNIKELLKNSEVIE